MPIVVLVAEDNFLIRTELVDALSAAGLSPIEAEHAERAQELLEKGWQGIDVLFSDVHMPPPSMSGLELAHLVHARWPRIGLLITSGHALLAAEDMPPGCFFLPKPYRHDHVVARIRQLHASR